ncbi:MAG: glycosyl hydrolase family 38 [Bacteroidales bacterium]|nr:glycosyl hydrolase family 38 [Bacteroidales bacterium]
MLEKGREVQPVLIRIIYFGQPKKATLYVNGEQLQNLYLQFGVQQFTVQLPAVEYPAPFTFRLESPGFTSEKSITLKPARHWQVNFVQHTHTDIGYTRPQTEILAEHLRYIDYALDYCDATDTLPEEARFKWTCEAAFAVDNYLQSRPQSQIDRLKKRIREGRIEVTGMYFNFDETPDEQSYAASLAPLARFRAAGIPVQTAMQDDVNGIGWCFADFFPKAGIKYLNMGTHIHRALLVFDKPTAFWWESPSGNRVLTFRAEHYMIGNTQFGIHTQNFEHFERTLMEYLSQLAAKGYPLDIIPLQYSGYQTDNSPPSTLACEMIRKWNTKYEWPKLKTATISEFFNYVATHHADDLPVIRGAWPDWWTDGYGSAAREVAACRQAHTDIIANQEALAMARIMGSPMPAEINERINLVNQAILFYDEHTFGHAQSVREPYFEGTMDQRALKESYAWEAFRRSRRIGEEALGLLQAYLQKDPENPTLTLFNTLNWKRSGLARVYIDHQMLPMGIQFKILDPENHEVPAQALEQRSDGTYWGIWATDIPAFGYKTYKIIVDKGHSGEVEKWESDQLKKLKSNQVIQLENNWYKIKISKSSGSVISLYDKELHSELVDSGARWKMDQFILEKPGNRSQLEALTLNDYERIPLDTVWFETYETGPVWNTVRFKGETSTAINPEGFMLELRIFNTTKRIDFVYMIRKKAITDPEGIYIAFPFSLPQGKIYCEVQGGVMEAGVDQIVGSSNDWNTVQNFVAVRNHSGQIILSSQKIPLMQFGGINTGRFKAGAKPATTHLFGWPMNNYWTTNFNADQRGELTFTYSMTSTGNSGNLFATHFGWGNRIPLLARVLPPGSSPEAPLQQSLLRILPENFLLVNAKPVENQNAILMQIREIAGEATEFSVEIQREKTKSQKPKTPKKNIIETDVTGRPIDQPGKKLFFKPLETKFILLNL